MTQFPLEVRHPLVDLRLVNYLLSIPPVPWCIKKELLRVAMRGVLPEPVRLRRKAPLAGDPVSELLRNRHAHWLHDFASAPQLTHYVDRTAVRPVSSEDDSNRLWLNLRPFSLNSWLQRVRPINYTSEQRGAL